MEFSYSASLHAWYGKRCTLSRWRSLNHVLGLSFFKEWGEDDLVGTEDSGALSLGTVISHFPCGV